MTQIKSVLDLLEMQNKPVDSLIQELIKDAIAVFNSIHISSELENLLNLTYERTEQLRKVSHPDCKEEIITLWVGLIAYVLAVEKDKKYHNDENSHFKSSLQAFYKSYREETSYQAIDNAEDGGITDNNPAIKTSNMQNFLTWIGNKALSDEISFMADFLQIKKIPRKIKEPMVIFHELNGKSLTIDRVTSIDNPHSNFFPKYVAAYSFLNMLSHLRGQAPRSGPDPGVQA